MLADYKKSIDTFPDNVVVIGSGRWARVLTEVLCAILPLRVTLSIHSNRNVNGIKQWLAERSLKHKVDVYSGFSTLPSNKLTAVIVVNAARDHEQSVEWALGQGCPVLVEKPICLNSFSAQRLVNLALARNVYLATAHCFLFASYIESFAKLVSYEKKIQSLRVLWMDPQSESRYGETKSYDPGLPVYADWLPHILSILGSFVPSPIWLCKNLIFLRGGSHLNIHFTCNHLQLHVELIRNGDSRQRIIEVITRHKKIFLDFSCEPGIIYTDGAVLGEDTQWNSNPKPVSKMLSAFLKGAAGGTRDVRLNCSIGLSASQVIDQVTSIYRAALLPWLIQELGACQDLISSDLRYAINEILQMDDPNSSISIEQRIAYTYRNIKERVKASNVEKKFCFEGVLTQIIKEGRISSYL